jgi:hypothetical protein
MKRNNMTLAWQLNDAARELRPHNRSTPRSTASCSSARAS